MSASASCFPAIQASQSGHWLGDGRALQEDFSELGDVRSCINVSGLCLEPFVLRAMMDISERAISLAVRFACAGKTDPPSRFHPLAELKT
jgi:hypothetical protein